VCYILNMAVNQNLDEDSDYEVETPHHHILNSSSPYIGENNLNKFFAIDEKKK
jgi:hypothetical protein